MNLQPYNNQFQQVINIIETARENAYKKVNEELILMYLDMGRYLREQSDNASSGGAFVPQLADFF